MDIRPNLQKLLRFNEQVLDQALQVIDALEAHPSIDYAAYTGPHLRHVIEHYEAFTLQLDTRSVDYDTRPRDAAVERDPAAARERVRSLQARLRSLVGNTVEEPIAVHLRGGLDGEHNFVSFSTVGRELLFLSSHAAHHYAIVRLHCAREGLDLGADFGKAPSTVHHEHHR